MFKIVEHTKDQLVMEEIPVLHYVTGIFLMILGIIECIIPLNASSGLIPGMVLIIASIIFIAWGKATRVIVNRSKKAVYYIKRTLFIKRVKKYHFFEISRITLRNKGEDSEHPSDKHKCNIVMEKSSGSYKILFRNNSFYKSKEAVDIIHHYLQ